MEVKRPLDEDETVVIEIFRDDNTITVVVTSECGNEAAEQKVARFIHADLEKQLKKVANKEL